MLRERTLREKEREQREGKIGSDRKGGLPAALTTRYKNRFASSSFLYVQHNTSIYTLYTKVATADFIPGEEFIVTTNLLLASQKFNQKDNKFNFILDAQPHDRAITTLNIYC